MASRRARSLARMDRSRFLQVAHRNQSSGIRIRRQFHESGISLSKSTRKPGRGGGARGLDPVTALNVKSVIASPLDQAHLRPGRVSIHGAAWPAKPISSRLKFPTDRLQLESRRLWHAIALTMPGGSGAISGTRPEETTGFSRAPPIAWAALNRALQSGIPGATCTTLWTRSTSMSLKTLVRCVSTMALLFYRSRSGRNRVLRRSRF